MLEHLMPQARQAFDAIVQQCEGHAAPKRILLQLTQQGTGEFLLCQPCRTQAVTILDKNLTDKAERLRKDGGEGTKPGDQEHDWAKDETYDELSE